MEKEKKDHPNKELEECCKLRDEYLAGWKRAKADLMNYKKEEAERMAGMAKYAAEELAHKLIPVLDNLERAEQGMPEEKREDDYFKGFLQIKIQIKDLLRQLGVEEIGALGEKFDPNFHEIVGEAEGEDSGAVKEVVQKGYTLQGKVIRPAKVIIVK